MCQIEITDDGSHTILHKKTGEHFHSTFGAITESQHVFITNGINTLTKKPVSVFEAGFGTGLNAYLTLLWANARNINVEYTAVELFPLDREYTNMLNYADLLNDKINHFPILHSCPWEQRVKIAPLFSITKIKADISEIKLQQKFDIVFFDAFSPAVQPELWTPEIFAHLQKTLNSGGILVSYCVKGIVKQALREAGFIVKTLPGPPGKRHMLYAVKKD